MPTSKQRIMFTPSPRALAAIRRVATITERPASAVVGEQIEVLVEHMEALASILEQAKRMAHEEPQVVAAAARAAFEQVQAMLNTAEVGLEAVSADMQNQLAMFAADREPAPPSSNTGATKPHNDAIPPNTRKSSNA